MFPQRYAYPGDDAVVHLSDYLAVVSRRWMIVVLTMSAVVALVLVVSLLQTPVYEAEAELLLQSRTSEEIFDPAATRVPRVDPGRVQTEIGVMESRSVRDAVTEALGREARVTIQAEGNTDLVTVRAHSTDPAEAADMANTYAKVYIETRRQQLVDDLQRAVVEVQSQLDDIDADLESTGEPENQPPAASADQQRVREGSIEALRISLITQLNQLQSALNLTQTGGAQIVSEAIEPVSPVRPTPVRNALLAAVTGLLLGVGLAFVREHLDDTVKSRDDLHRISGGLPVLGLIPAVTGWKNRDTATLVSVSSPSSVPAESYRSLRTAVQFIALDHPVKAIQVTSANALEGKTTTVANLAVALARAGQRVIMLSCDLRRSRLHEFFGLSDEVGFTSVLLGEVPLSDAVQTVPAEGRLALLAAGPAPPNPSELLASAHTSRLVAMLKKECDILLVDSPPVLPVTDAMVLARLVDATVFVARANRTTRKDVRQSVETLNQVSAPLIGTVLNGVPYDSSYGYAYAYTTPATKDADNGSGSAGTAASTETSGEPGAPARSGGRGPGHPRRETPAAESR